MNQVVGVNLGVDPAPVLPARLGGVHPNGMGTQASSFARMARPLTVFHALPRGRSVRQEPAETDETRGLSFAWIRYMEHQWVPAKNFRHSRSG